MMKKFMSSILVLTLVLSLFAGFAMTANAAETGNVAKIGDVEYATLADAVNDAKDGDTIVLLCSIELTASQYVEKEVTIDLGGNTLSATGCRALVANTASGYLTIQNGTVSSNASGTVTANYNSTVVLGENVTVISTGNFGVYVNRGTLKVSEPSAKAYGKARGVSAKTNDDKPEYFYISAGSYSAAISAEWIEEGFYGVWAKDEAGNTVYVIEASVHVVDQAGNVGRFGKLADAIAAAETGDTIILQKDISVDAEDMVDLDGYHTFFKVENKDITVDLNGKTVYADASAVTDKFVVGVFSTTNGGHLTLTGDGTVQGYSGENQEAAYLDPAKGNTDYNYKFYTLLAVYDDECSITVNGGNYVLDYAGDSMAYTSTNEGIIVNGGTFTLGNLGGIRNGMPWVFNARGQNIRHVVVNGGTFCADIQHQYYPFEVLVPKELALDKSVEGQFTIVDAVAYVTEREWSSAWYTNEIGYATLQEAFAACEGVKTKVVGNKTYTSEPEEVHLLQDITLTKNTTITVGNP